MAKKTFIGRAFISITGDKRGLDAVLSVIRKDMEKLGKELQAIGYKFMATGAAIQAPLALAVRQFAQFGDQMAKAGKRVGLTAETFAELAHVAGLSGSNVESLEKALLIMGRNMFQAGGQTKEFREAMSALGVSMADLVKLSPDQRFALLADRMKNIADPSRKAALAMQIFGRSGAQLIPLIDLGSEGIAHYREEFKRLHGELSPQAAGMAEQLADMFERLKLALAGIAHTVGEILGPSFEKFLTFATNLSIWVREFIREHPQLVIQLQQLAIGLTAAGASLVGLGTGLRLLAPLVSPGGVLLGIGAGLLYVSGALDPFIDKWGKAILNFELGGKKVREWLKLVGDSFLAMWDSVKVTFRTLGELLEPFAQTVGAVAEGAWATIKVGFFKLLGDVEGSLGEMLRRLGWLIAKFARHMSDIFADVALYPQRMALEGAAKLIELRTGSKAVADLYRKYSPQAVALRAQEGAARIYGRTLETEWGHALSQEIGPALEENAAQNRVRLVGAKIEANSARKAAAFSVQALTSLAGDAFGYIGRDWTARLKMIADPWAAALKGMVDMLSKGFREPQGAGGPLVDYQMAGSSGPLVDFQMRAGPAMQAATATLGTFSGRGARAIGTDPILDVQREALDVLKSIDSKVGGGGAGGEEF